MTPIETSPTVKQSQSRPRRSPSRAGIPVEALMLLIGPEAATKLIRTYAGRGLPTITRLLKSLQHQAIIAHRLNHGASVLELSRKYQLSVSSVQRIIDEDQRLRRQARRANELVRLRQKSREER